MKVVLSVFGSRGDVQPVAALGRRLQQRGHGVVLCAPENFAGWSARIGLPFVPVGRDILDLFQRTGVDVLRMTRELRAELGSHFDALSGAVAGADLVLGAGVPVAARSVAERCGVPYRFVAYCPLALRSRHHPPPHFFAFRGIASASRALWGLTDLLFDLAGAEVINAYRTREGLPPIRGVWDHVVGERPLLAADPVLAPLPPDLTAEVAQTGAWMWTDPSSDGDAQEELERFMSEGSPPVYLGFGSMPVKQPEALVDTVRSAISSLGCRAVVSLPAGARERLRPSGDLFIAGPFPHPAFFPRMVAVAHHGGAGTTTTAARCGVPQVVVPHMLDQHYWGHRVFQLGLGPPPISRRALSGKRLAGALSLAMSPRLRARAAQLAAELRTDGIDQALVHLLDSPQKCRILGISTNHRLQFREEHPP